MQQLWLVAAYPNGELMVLSSNERMPVTPGRRIGPVFMTEPINKLLPLSSSYYDIRPPQGGVLPLLKIGEAPLGSMAGQQQVGRQLAFEAFPKLEAVMKDFAINIFIQPESMAFFEGQARELADMKLLLTTWLHGLEDGL